MLFRSLEVQPGTVTVLADTAIRGHDLDEAKALEAKKLAEEAMKNAKTDIDFAKAQGEFATMAAQIAAIAKANAADPAAAHVFDDGPSLGWQLAAADVGLTTTVAPVLEPSSGFRTASTFDAA